MPKLGVKARVVNHISITTFGKRHKLHIGGAIIRRKGIGSYRVFAGYLLFWRSPKYHHVVGQQALNFIMGCSFRF